MTQTQTPRADPLPTDFWMHTGLEATTTKVDTATMVVRAVITTKQPDRAGDVIIPGGLQNAKQFLRNPVVLWAHQRTWPPIGACQKLDVQKDCIVAETKFSESSPFARDVFKLYAEGILRAWSVGFLPQEIYPIPPSRDRPEGGMCFTKWDLLEYSAVPIPENPEALTLAIHKGLITDPGLRHWLVRDVMAALHA